MLVSFLGTQVQWGWCPMPPRSRGPPKPKTWPKWVWGLFGGDAVCKPQFANSNWPNSDLNFDSGSGLCLSLMQFINCSNIETRKLTIYFIHFFKFFISHLSVLQSSNWLKILIKEHKYIKNVKQKCRMAKYIIGLTVL